MDAARTPDLARHPLVLAPSDATGWFSGTALIASDPVSREVGASLSSAAGALERAFEGSGSGLTAALILYDGTAEVREYASAENAAVHNRPTPRPTVPIGPLLADAHLDMDEGEWVGRVRAAQEMIRSGDVYVLNLTMRATGTVTVGPADAFAALLDRAAAPMSALWGSPDDSIVSISPERFLAVRMDGDRRRVEVWPIKGTAPRDTDSASDSELARALAACEKERAEHVMIVDMERNDLGRVCEPGSVQVDPLMSVFATPYCHQMVSKVSGLMRPDAGFADLLAATFPCGSVTGAPKIAAMRAIQELECGPRGAYTGALVVAMRGRLDSSVLIRSLEYGPDGTGVWGTGCGITIDSDPEAEWREAMLKAGPVRE